MKGVLLVGLKTTTHSGMDWNCWSYRLIIYWFKAFSLITTFFIRPVKAKPVFTHSSYKSGEKVTQTLRLRGPSNSAK